LRRRQCQLKSRRPRRSDVPLRDGNPIIDQSSTRAARRVECARSERVVTFRKNVRLRLAKVLVAGAWAHINLRRREALSTRPVM
jgi:hypothetical protein